MEKNPIQRFRDAYSRAEKSGMDLPEAAGLATVGEEGQPSLRMVLLKGVDEDGFVFYTNLRSQKGKEIAKNPRVALCFWWPPIQEQVRIEGTVVVVSDAEADAYFATRDRSSQIGAWASQQSDEMKTDTELLDAVEKLADEYENRDVPRPSHWSGYRLRPERIEFWKGRPFRLHERHLYTRRGDGWVITSLYP
jgi:pyridoxamine 5'-phosphate oxidase